MGAQRKSERDEHKVQSDQDKHDKQGKPIVPLTAEERALAAQWYADLTPALRNWLRQQCLWDITLAEDILHEAVLRLLRHVREAATMTSEHRRRYLNRIARNLIIDAIRHAATRAEQQTPFSAYDDPMRIPIAPPEQFNTQWLTLLRPETHPEQVAEAREALREALAALDTQTLRYALLTNAGYSQDEMAAQEGVPTHKIKMRLFRGREKARKILASQEPTREE